VLGGGADAARHLGAGVEAPAAGGRGADDYGGSGGSSACRRGKRMGRREKKEIDWKKTGINNKNHIINRATHKNVEVQVRAPRDN
jgi:hypothetical protein